MCGIVNNKKGGMISMAEIKWKLVNVKQVPGRGGEAFATVGQGRISLSSTACKMIENIYELKYVEAHAGKVNDTTEKIGLRFSKTKTQNSLCYARRKYKGEYVEGLEIRSKALIAEFFGKTKDNSSTRHPVEKIDNTMIAIDITKEMQ